MTKAKHDDDAKPVEAKHKPSKLNDLLAQLDEAFDALEAKKASLVMAHAASMTAVSDAQVVFDAVKADHAAKVAMATKEADDARAVLEGLRGQVNERVGSLTGQGTDPRVSVR